jgi:hypothetical protein
MLTGVDGEGIHLQAQEQAQRGHHGTDETVGAAHGPPRHAVEMPRARLGEVSLGILDHGAQELRAIGIALQRDIRRHQVVHLREVPSLQTEPRNLGEHLPVDVRRAPGERAFVAASLDDQAASVPAADGNRIAAGSDFEGAKPGGPRLEPQGDEDVVVPVAVDDDVMYAVGM